MRKLLLTSAAVAMLAVPAISTQAQAQEGTPTTGKFMLDKPSTLFGIGAGLTWASVMYHMIDTHQRALKGEKFVAVSTPVYGGEEYAQLSSATPLYGAAKAESTFASVFQPSDVNVASAAK